MNRFTGLGMLAVLVSGCAAPGSMLTQVEIGGLLLGRDGAPRAGERLDVMLPAAYGLAGLDRVIGQPEDYGHRALTAEVVTDDAGRFVHRFEPTTYSIAFFLIPPIGPIPWDPPEPTVAIRAVAAGATWLVVTVDGDELECGVVDPESRSVATLSAGEVSGTAGLAEMARDDEGNEPLEGWRLDVTIRRP